MKEIRHVTKFWLVNYGGRISLGSVKLGVSDLIKWILENYTMKYRLDLPVVTCDAANESAGAIKSWVFLD
jgi:hypothetical protein